MLEGKTAIITGSSAGIGLAIAETLAQNGANVVVNGRNADKLKLAENKIKNAGGSVFAVRADVSEEKEIERIINETVEKFGSLDFLINNAATVGVGYSVEQMPLEIFDEVLSKNLRAVFLMCQKAIPHLKKSAGGRIINIGGLSAKTPLPFAAADACAKAGINALTRVLAAELGAAKISVNTVTPGYQPETEIGKIFNEKLATAFHITPEQSIAATKNKTLLKRFETTAEIAGTVLYLCSAAGAAITGQNINVSCGLSAS